MRYPVLVLAAIAGLGVGALPDANAAPAPVHPDTPSTALLITGDQVSEGHGQGTVIPAVTSGIGRTDVHLRLGGRSYEIPAVALPYLGRGLDPSLFDVDALLAGEAGDGRLPVRISGSHSVPGVTITGSANGSATGYLTVAGARQFGAALIRQYLADRSTASYGTDGLFGAGTAISLAGAQPRTAVRPDFPMHTLTVTAKDPSGKPDTGDTAFVYNVDDSNRFGDPNESTEPFYAGTAKYSVPEGHYAALAVFLTTDSAGNVTAAREVSEPEFTVSGDRTIALDAARASSEVTMVTPKPALLQESGFAYERSATTGPDFYLDVSDGPGVPFWVAPASRKVTVGALNTYPYQRLTSPPGPGTPYEYDLQYPAAGTIPAQRYVVRPADLAAVDSSYYSDYPTSGVRQLTGTYPFDGLVLRGAHPMNFPAHQTEYVSAQPNLSWFGGISKYQLGSNVDFGWYGGQYDTATIRRPGTTERDDWNRYPLHAAGWSAPDHPGPEYLQPAAIRTGDTVDFDIFPFTDDQAGHTGFGYYGESRDTISGAYEVDVNGTKLSGGPVPEGLQFGQEVTLPAAASTVRLVLDATREGPMYRLSTRSHTEWTWRSAHEQGSTLPAPWVCQPGKGGPPVTACAVEPLMTVEYGVHDLAVDGSVPGGPQAVDLTVGHLQAAAGSAITGATTQFSTDDGTTWQNATVTGQNGNYTAAFTAQGPAYPFSPPVYVTLRITATDAAGGQITETITRAYALTTGGAA